MKRVYNVLIVIAVIVITSAAILYCVKEKDKVIPGSYWEESQENYNIYSVKLPDKVSFADENVPLEKYYVTEKLDRELIINTYWHTSTILLMKRANRWFPVVEPILGKNDIPSDFKYLALIESGLMQVTSPSGAKGFWQFLEGTAKDYGLEVNRHIDERYHVEKATQAACDYLKDLHERYGSWTMAAAAYNTGQNRLSEEVELQKKDDYYELYLNPETSRYVYRILAVKTIFEDPVSYGFNIRIKDLYMPLDTRYITVDESVNDLYSFARENGVTYKMLKELNPWLLNSSLKVKRGREYKVKIPHP